ncbi:NnrU family protein [Thioalkalivibrio denitrificans]|uniref:NnrU family protein n=1 Tax=Thioalkalivibrio denitrificans TaxID=108003 RepID=A0A1V3NCJ9_9GAMM|nr:NnrU family protein [Thioalkalivibrio denitrificans]OOG22771.1 NnrU family protein [Thioalkalivibrio denitrificans]
MLTLIAGLVIFLGVHSVAIVAPGWRERMVARMGLLPWMAVYSVIAVVGLVLIIQGYAMARQAPVVLYWPPVWLRHIALLLMIPVFPLLLATYLPGRIQARVRHPMLAAVKLWAVAHLLANGMLADVLLFGGFLAWAVVDRISLKRRNPPSPPGLPPGALNDAIAVVGGLAVYVAFILWLHAWLIGVPVVAM